jgi:hypothetical protein
MTEDELPKPEDTREERMERLAMAEMKTRILENNNDLLRDIIDQYRGQRGRPHRQVT